MLFVGTEFADFVDYCGEQFAGRERAVTAQGRDQALFAKFLEDVIEGFGDAVGVKGKSVTGL